MSLFLERLKLRHPHSPCASVALRNMDTVMVTLVVFTTRMTVSLPCLGESGRVEHGSTVAAPELLLTGAVVTVGVTSRVGNASGVSVGGGVSVGVSVGGTGVAVGIAAWVCATMVKAAAIAVFCTSTGLTVGTAGAPQAVMSVARVARATILVSVENRFMRW